MKVRNSEFLMPHWLFKSEPSVFSFEKLAGEGAKGTDWSGIRNHSAKLNMMAMKLGERGFFYHSNEGKAIVGSSKSRRSIVPTRPTRRASSAWSTSGLSSRCRSR